MKLIIKDIQGQNQGEMDVTLPLIENKRGTQAVHDTVVAFNAAQRSGTACTKTVGEVNGTNKKPWRQKGTGRARAGSFASPLWRGGGVVFGPRPRSYDKKVNASTRKLALLKALSGRIIAGEVSVVKDITLAAPKTKELAQVLNTLKIQGKVVVVIDGLNKNLELAARNMPSVELVTSDAINTSQLLWPKHILFTQSAFGKIEKRLQ